MWWPAVVKSEFPLRLDYGQSLHAYVNQRLQIQLELLMMSGMPLETCWSFNERWNNKFYHNVASCWLFLLKKSISHLIIWRINSKRYWPHVLFIYCVLILYNFIRITRPKIMQGGTVYKAAYSKIPDEKEESQIDLISCQVNILYQAEFVSAKSD